jgi:hypothetical protein
VILKGKMAIFSCCGERKERKKERRRREREKEEEKKEGKERRKDKTKMFFGGSNFGV